MDIQIPGNAAQAAPQPDRAIRIAPPISLDANDAVEAAQGAASARRAKPAPDEQQVSQALNSINEVLKSRSPDLEFSVDKDSNRSIVKVVDKNTQEVIRQMPTQEALEIAKALDRLQSMLIRETA